MRVWGVARLRVLCSKEKSRVMRSNSALKQLPWPFPDGNQSEVRDHCKEASYFVIHGCHGSLARNLV